MRHIILLLAAVSIASGQSLQVLDLRCEGLIAPVGVDLPNPALSWRLEQKGAPRGQRQTAYQLLVASDSSKLAANEGDLWDSGKVHSEQCVRVSYAGVPLNSRERCHWKVRVWDKDGQQSAWSSPSEWTMGLLKAGDWSAKWIACPASGTSGTAACTYPWMRRTFELNSAVKRALVFVNTPGNFELYLNGSKVSDDVLAPAYSDFTKRMFVVAYDVTPLLRQGSNCIALWMAPGWYQPRYGNPHGSPIVRAQLEIETREGSVVIGTDSTWRTKESCISQIDRWSWAKMGGERWDDAGFIPDWNLASHDDADWPIAKEVESPAVAHSWLAMPGNRIGKPIPASRVFQSNGQWIIDFGTTLTGWIDLKLSNLTPGQKITIDYADLVERPELMHLRDGNGFQSFGQRDIFVAGNSPEGGFRSRFNQHGFRYAVLGGLTGAPHPKDAVALPIMTDLEPAGTFECSNPLFNKIHRITMATYRTQIPVGVLGGGEPREKEGYGDAGAFLTGLLYNFRSDGFFRKWLVDFTDGQRNDGFIPHTAPRHVNHGGGPPWGGQASELARRLLLYYGDTSAISKAYPSLKRYVDYIESKTKDDILRFYSPYGDKSTWFLGDWVTPTDSENKHGFPEDTLEEKEFFNNCYRVILWDQLATFAEKMGDTAESARCRKRLAVLRPLIHKEFFDAKTNTYRAHRQAFLVVALLARIMPEELRPSFLRQLADSIAVTSSGHLGTGMIGTSFMLDLLAREGRNDLVSQMMAKTTYPSWGFLSETRGVSTWPETWTGWGSQIILVTGSPGAWFHEGLGGLRPDPAAPGFRKFIVRPGLVREVDWTRVTHQSPYGPIAVEWRKNHGSLNLDVSVPPGTTAEIHVPARAVDGVTESGRSATTAPGVRFLREENGDAVFEVGSGSYSFQGTIPRTLRPVTQHQK